MGLCAVLHDLLRPLKYLRRDDLQLRQQFGTGFAVDNDAGVNLIFYHTVDAGVGEVPAASAPDALVVQPVAEPLCAVALVHILVKNQANDLSLLLVHHQLTDLVVPLVDTALLFNAVSERNRAAGVVALLSQLFQPGLGADGGFQTFAGCLPIADVIHQLVHMGVEPLLTFPRTPHLNAVFHEPFHHKGRLIVPAAKTVKHEHQQDVKSASEGVLLDALDGVPVFGGDLIPGDALLKVFFYDFPAHVVRKFTAFLLLHGNVVFFYLAGS